MNSYKCRAKRKDNGEWVYGYIYEHEPPLQCIVPENYVPEKSNWYILQTDFADWNMPRQVDFIEIDSKTIGRYTCQEDKNNKEIYEGDILQGNNANYCKLVSWLDTGFKWKSILNRKGQEIQSKSNKPMPIYDYEQILYPCRYEIVGNIYDNPELLDK